MGPSRAGVGLGEAACIPPARPGADTGGGRSFSKTSLYM